MRGRHEPESLFWLYGKDWERRDQDPQLSSGLNSLNNFGGHWARQVAPSGPVSGLGMI